MRTVEVDMEAVALTIERAADQQGWDQPATVYDIFPGSGWTLGGRTVLPDHLRWFLGNHFLTKGAIGAAIVVEGWSTPDDGQGLPQPESQEVRSVVVVMRDGRASSAIRVRGEEPYAHEEALGGRLVDALRRYALIAA